MSEQPNEFHKHELMDRAYFVVNILEMLEENLAHTPDTRRAWGVAMDALYQFYQVAANERFKEPT